MTDIMSKGKKNEAMSKIRSTNTKIELALRKNFDVWVTGSRKIIKSTENWISLSQRKKSPCFATANYSMEKFLRNGNNPVLSATASASGPANSTIIYFCSFSNYLVAFDNKRLKFLHIFFFKFF